MIRWSSEHGKHNKPPPCSDIPRLPFYKQANGAYALLMVLGMMPTSSVSRIMFKVMEQGLEKEACLLKQDIIWEEAETLIIK